MQHHLWQGIDTVIVRVSDLQYSRQWYQEKLQLKVIWEHPSTPLVVLDTNGPTNLTLWQTEKAFGIQQETAVYPIFRTADAETAHQFLQQQQVEVEELQADAFVRYFFFHDPDGNLLEAYRC